VVAGADPWPGSVALYSSLTDQNYALNTVLPLRATIGRTTTAMAHAPAGLRDHGAGLEVKLMSGTLESITEKALLSGANLAAIGDGSVDNWELFQFQNAELIAPKTYRLTARLRGQAGSDGLMPASWPTGSEFVLLNSVPQQIELSRNMRGVVQNFRIGPAAKSVDDPSFVQLEHAFSGNGLRPYAPAHLTATSQGNGDLNIAWIRRTRVDGDGWEASSVPLGEESESYSLRIVHQGTVVREEICTTAAYAYSASEQALDGVAGAFTIEVAQVSASYGNGLFARIAVVAS
jgi:hypothetical protein